MGGLFTGFFKSPVEASETLEAFNAGLASKIFGFGGTFGFFSRGVGRLFVTVLLFMTSTGVVFGLWRVSSDSINKSQNS